MMKKPSQATVPLKGQDAVGFSRGKYVKKGFCL